LPVEAAEAIDVFVGHRTSNGIGPFGNVKPTAAMITRNNMLFAGGAMPVQRLPGAAI
jgi:hypothetical protein